jgi:hypothetical protein
VRQGGEWVIGASLVGIRGPEWDRWERRFRQVRGKILTSIAAFSGKWNIEGTSMYLRELNIEGGSFQKFKGLNLFSRTRDSIQRSIEPRTI